MVWYGMVSYDLVAPYHTYLMYIHKVGYVNIRVYEYDTINNMYDTIQYYLLHGDSSSDF